MRIGLVKLTSDRHALEIDRGDGHVERVELETRSCLIHDLTHFAVERAARFDVGFFGALAAGRTLADLAPQPDAGPAAVMYVIERAVALLQGLAKSGEDPDAAHARIADLAACQSAALPAWFTVEFVRDVAHRMRALLGAWRATPFGGRMELRWEPFDASALPVR